MPSVESMLINMQLRWVGHVRRMDNNRLPKAVFYGELSQGAKPRGRPRLRFKDVIERHLKAIDIPCDHWEKLADDRRR